MGVYVVGTSLGGYFAKIINQTLAVTAILVNPSLVPFLTLREYLNNSQCKSYIELLAKYAYVNSCEDDFEFDAPLCEEDEVGSENPVLMNRYHNRDYLHVIIGDSDETIDHEKLTKPLLPPRFRNLYTIRGGKHQLDMTPEVENIFKSVIRMPEGLTDGDPRFIHHCGEIKLP
jgi:hypothetical protein